MNITHWLYKLHSRELVIIDPQQTVQGWKNAWKLGCQFVRYNELAFLWLIIIMSKVNTLPSNVLPFPLFPYSTLIHEDQKVTINLNTDICQHANSLVLICIAREWWWQVLIYFIIKFLVALTRKFLLSFSSDLFKQDSAKQSLRAISLNGLLSQCLQLLDSPSTHLYCPLTRRIYWLWYRYELPQALANSILSYFCDFMRV